jgi:DNA-binding transcriptional LysR family regulator
MIEIRQLRHFLAVVEAGGFRKASRDIHLSAPALTRSVQMLEEFYGVPLLDRAQDKVRPTSLGRQLALHAEHVIAGFDDIPNHLNQLAGLKASHIRLGVSPLISDLCMTGAMRQLIREWAGGELTLRVHMVATLLEQLHAGELDMVVGIERAMVLQGNLEVSRLYSDQAFWWVRKGHPLLDGAPLDLGSLSRYPLMFQELPLSYRVWLEALCIAVRENTGDTISLNGALQTSDYKLLISTLLGTDGIAIIPLRNVAVDGRCDKLVRLDLPLPPPPFHMAMAYRKGAPAPPQAESLMALLREQIATNDQHVEQCGFTDILPQPPA